MIKKQTNLNRNDISVITTVIWLEISLMSMKIMSKCKFQNFIYYGTCILFIILQDLDMRFILERPLKLLMDAFKRIS